MTERCHLWIDGNTQCQSPAVGKRGENSFCAEHLKDSYWHGGAAGATQPPDADKPRNEAEADWKFPPDGYRRATQSPDDLAQFIAENLFDTNLSAISAIADMIRPILAKWNGAADHEARAAQEIERLTKELANCKESWELFERESGCKEWPTLLARYEDAEARAERLTKERDELIAKGESLAKMYDGTDAELNQLEARAERLEKALANMLRLYRSGAADPQERPGQFAEEAEEALCPTRTNGNTTAE